MSDYFETVPYIANMYIFSRIKNISKEILCRQKQQTSTVGLHLTPSDASNKNMKSENVLVQPQKNIGLQSVKARNYINNIHSEISTPISTTLI